MQQYFNPRSPHGEQRQSLDTSSYHGHISIHAPRMGSDVTSDFQSFNIFVFQSTPPHGERHLCFLLPFWGIHNFNPRSPHGERQGLTSLIPLQRHILKAHRKQAVKFQSTLPAWGATPVRFPALRQFPYFNPRSSHGERRIRRWNRDLFQGFQSTLPAWGATHHSDR